MKNDIHIRLRKKLVTLLYSAHSGHIGSCLSCLDILIVLFISTMKKGDKFILSKGHAAPSLYVILNYLKKITNKELATFHQEGTRLPAHTPHYYFQDDIPFPTGSLGHGLSLASGIAHGYKYFSKKRNKVFCMISDGECNEGQVWEAAQYASHFKLSNLIVLIDKNKLQALGKINEVLGDSANVSKWNAFGFKVYISDGHNPEKIKDVLKKAIHAKTEKPKIVIFDTVKGHGISFMENKLEWHYNTLTEDMYNTAIKELSLKYED